MPERWTPDHWRKRPIAQMPDYPDKKALAEVEARLSTFPPLVFAGEARNLKKALARVAAGEAFLLQGGDCAESFEDHSANNIRDFFRVFLQMAVVLTFAAASPVVKVGRIAGQFAKPRSSPTEKRGAVELPSYRGDVINDAEFNAAARTPDPQRQVEAYHQSAATLNLLRAFAHGGYASLGRVHQWMLGFVKDSQQLDRYRQVADRISETLAFMQACGLDLESHPELRATDLYTSHEALLPGFEQAVTPGLASGGGTARPPYCGSAIARVSSTTHVDLPRHQERSGSSAPFAQTDELLRLIDILNVENEPGAPLICRLGADKAGDQLRHSFAVKREARHLSCDPMHGNTITSALVTKPAVRPILQVKAFFAVHATEGTYAGGCTRADGQGRDGVHRRRTRDRRRGSQRSLPRLATRGWMRSKRSRSLSCWPNSKHERTGRIRPASAVAAI